MHYILAHLFAITKSTNAYHDSPFFSLFGGAFVFLMTKDYGKYEFKIDFLSLISIFKVIPQ